MKLFMIPFVLQNLTCELVCTTSTTCFEYTVL